MRCDQTGWERDLWVPGTETASENIHLLNKCLTEPDTIQAVGICTSKVIMATYFPS